MGDLNHNCSLGVLLIAFIIPMQCAKAFYVLCLCTFLVWNFKIVYYILVIVLFIYMLNKNWLHLRVIFYLNWKIRKGEFFLYLSYKVVRP